MQSNAQNDGVIRLPARIDMMDGTRLEVSVISPRALLKLAEILNREERFLEVEDHHGERLSIAKTSIKSVKARDLPKARPLPEVDADGGKFDPYRILGLDPSAGGDAVREAYQRLAREYHPDRFAGAGLPREINDYLAAMTKRITTAYDMLARDK